MGQATGVTGYIRLPPLRQADSPISKGFRTPRSSTSGSGAETCFPALIVTCSAPVIDLYWSKRFYTGLVNILVAFASFGSFDGA